VPSRDDFYMGMAFWYASRSKDPNTQIGALIISADNKPLGFGYNGPPKEIDDNAIDWDRPQKYPFIKHAEANAIRHTINKSLLQGATIYITSFPCKSCALDIVDVGIKKVVFFKVKNVDPGSLLADTSEWKITVEIMKLGHVALLEFNGDLNWMRDRIRWMESLGVFDI
jgi:dCMP deaminase